MHYPDAETRPLSVEEARAFRTPTVWKLTDDDLQRKPSSVPEPGPDAPASAGAQGAAGAPAPWEVPQNHPLRLEAQKAQAAVKVLKQEQRRLVEALKSILRKAIDLGPQASVAFDELRTFVKSACAEVGISPDGSMRYRAVHAFEPLPPDPERITCVLYTNPQKRVLEAFVELLSCWEWAPRGKFNSEAALSIADRLLKRLGVKDLPKRVEPTPGACLHRRVIVTEGFAECQECRVELEYNAEMRNWTPKNYDAPRENSQSTRQRPVEGGARDHWHEFAFNLLRTHPGNVDMVGSIAAEFRSLAKHLDDANERKAKAEAWAAQERDRCGLIISAILGHGGQSDISAASVEASMCAIQMRGLLEYLLKLGDVVPSKIHAWARAALDGELNLDAMPKLAPPPAVDSGKEFFDVPIPEAPMHIISVQQQLRGCLNVVHALNSGFCLKCGGFFKPASDGEFRCPHCSFAIPPALVKDLVAEGKPILDECTEAFDAWGAEWMSRRDAENPL